MEHVLPLSADTLDTLLGMPPVLAHIVFLYLPCGFDSWTSNICITDFGLAAEHSRSFCLLAAKNTRGCSVGCGPTACMTIAPQNRWVSRQFLVEKCQGLIYLGVNRKNPRTSINNASRCSYLTVGHPSCFNYIERFPGFKSAVISLISGGVLSICVNYVAKTILFFVNGIPVARGISPMGDHGRCFTEEDKLEFWINLTESKIKVL